MKKLLTLAAVAVLILGLAAATYAVELKVNGFFQNKTAWGVNINTQLPGAQGIPAPDPYDPAGAWAAIVGPSNTGYDDSFAFNYIWTHLDFTLEASEDLKGVIGFEAGPAMWGSYSAVGPPAIPGVVTYPYITDGHGTHGSVYPGYTANVYQAYVDFKVPGTDAFPTRMLVGLQPWFFTSTLAIGEYGPGVRLNSTVGPASISLLWRKMEEGLSYQADDMDSYGVSVSVPAGPVTPSIWSMYYLIRQDASDVRTGPFTLPAGTDINGDGLADPVGSTDGYHWYTGLNVRGAVGPVAITGDFVYGMRKVDYNYPVIVLGGGWYGQNVIYDGEDTSGWVARVDASIPVGMVTVGGGFMYATGGDNADYANDRDWSGYLYPIPSRNYFGLNVATLGDVGMVYFKSFTNVFPGLTGQAGGDWYARGFARMKPLEWLSVSFNAMYIGDNVKNGDKFGTAVDFLGFPEDNDDAGIEVDILANIHITDGLSYEIGAGYLFAGSALDQNVADPLGLLPFPMNDSPKNPWLILSSLNYFF